MHWTLRKICESASSVGVGLHTVEDHPSFCFLEALLMYLTCSVLVLAYGDQWKQ